MALLARILASFQAAAPVPSLTPLDNELNQLTGANGALNGGSTSNRILTKYSHATEPVLELDQLGAGLIQQWKQSGAEKGRIENDGDLVVNGITGAGGVYTFGNIPVLPALDPTTANQAARKAYIDGRHTRWSANWFIQDPSTFPLNSFNLAQKAFVPGANFRVVQIGYIYNTGSASGSFSVELRRHLFADQTAQTVLGTITVNPGAVGVGAITDIADVTFVSGDFVYPVLTARSSPLQRDVTIFAWGFQTPEQVA